VKLFEYIDLEKKLNRINNIETKVKLEYKIKSLASTSDEVKELQDILNKYSKVPKIGMARMDNTVDLQTYLRIDTEVHDRFDLSNNYYSVEGEESFTNYEALYYDPFIGESGIDILSQPNDILKHTDYHKVGNDITADRRSIQKLYTANYKQLRRPGKLIPLVKLGKRQRKSSTLKSLNEITYVEEIAHKKIFTGDMNIYLNEDLIERIYFCPQNNNITLDANESNKVGILLLDYLRIEKENKIKSIEYENTLNEFVQKYEEEMTRFTTERESLLEE
jgi:hypothetical protein